MANIFTKFRLTGDHAAGGSGPDEDLILDGSDEDLFLDGAAPEPEGDEPALNGAAAEPEGDELPLNGAASEAAGGEVPAEEGPPEAPVMDDAPDIDIEAEESPAEAPGMDDDPPEIDIEAAPEPLPAAESAEDASDVLVLSAERRLSGMQLAGAPEEALPRFHFAPLDAAGRRVSAPDADGARQMRLWEAFTPRRPTSWCRVFAGRRWALRRIISAIEEEQAHVLIFGPRGIGKTSLTNALAECAVRSEYQVLKYPCSSDTTFEDIFRGLLTRLPADFMDRAGRANLAEAENFEQLLPRGNFGPTELTRALGHLALEHAILIIDEFDRIVSERTKNQLAECIKNLSDAAARVTIVILGIAQSAEELVGKHPSIQRHMISIHLPLMEPDELHRIVQIGERESGIAFDDAARDMIVSFSKGLPYYTQLLCLYSGQAALARDADSVGIADFRKALEKSVQEADPLVKAAYDLATHGDHNQFMTDVLFAAASARFDKYGSFSARDAAKVVVNDHGHRVLELTLHRALSALSDGKYYFLIEKRRTPARETRYFFSNQTMRQYIILHQAQARGIM